MLNLSEWTAETWSAVVAVLAMLVSGYFSLAARAATKKQIKLQRLQARQDPRNSARAWADEVVAVLQDGITHCFINKQNPEVEATSRHFTRLAGKTSELIDRGRWHFENDKQSGFGQWKEGAYQGLAPAVIHILKCAYNNLVCAANDPPGCADDYDQLRKKLTDNKREFVSEVQNFVQPSRSMSELGP